LDFYNIAVKKDAMSEMSWLSIRILKRMPDVIALPIGDAVHNLRAALDLIVYETIQAINGKPSRKAAFPFNADRENLLRSAEYGAIQKVSADAATLILDTIKPYKTGNFPLWGLNKLDVIDKHHLLIPTAHVTGFTVERVRDSGDKVTESFAFGWDDVVGIDTLHTKGDLKIESYSKPVTTIFFGPETPFKAQPVLEVLTMRVIDVQRIIQQFAKAGFGAQP
jgi:hypothetical protein